MSKEVQSRNVLHTSCEEIRQPTSKAEEGVHLNLDEELSISSYIQEVKPSQNTVRDISRWADQQRETTRTRLAMWLAKGLGYSLGLTFLLMGVAAFTPKADRDFIKDLIPQVITPQVTLLSVALGFYFGTKEE